MKTYNIDEIVDMIQSCKVMIDIDDMFKDGQHITKKEYGHLVIKELCSELKEKHS